MKNVSAVQRWRSVGAAVDEVLAVFDAQRHAYAAIIGGQLAARRARRQIARTLGQARTGGAA